MEVACPGKVLLTGGYLILYPQYSGLVLSTSCRISARLTPISGEPRIHVLSPRFQKTWDFAWTGPTAEQEADNPFVSAAVWTVTQLAALCKHYVDDREPVAVQVDIQADEQFYGDGKSGLGSSAAVICSVLSVLCKQLGLESRPLLHLACQLANSKAQNKIGSGFDIAACLFGSHVFRRIACPELSTLTSSVTKAALEDVLQRYPWDQVETFTLPAAYHVVLAPMGQGSNTRILAAQVIKWFQSGPTGPILFDTLHALNQDIQKRLQQEDDVGLRRATAEVWALQRQLSELSGVEVLPDAVLAELTRVVAQLPNVVLAGVPGAGGYDAAYFVVRADSWTAAETQVCQELGRPCLQCEAR